MEIVYNVSFKNAPNAVGRKISIFFMKPSSVIVNYFVPRQVATWKLVDFVYVIVKKKIRMFL